MRKRIYEIIEIAKDNDILSTIYDIFMIITIIASIIPLTVKETSEYMILIDKICLAIFIFDYILRLFTADYKYKEYKKFFAILKYPFSPMAIIDLLSILPFVLHLNQGFRVLRLLRLISALRVFRIFKALRYSKSLKILRLVMKDSKDSLFAVCTLAVLYILISALLVFHAEPETFNSFFDAVYWATESLATLGYGDIYPVTTMGKIITMVSSVFGIAIIALPSSIITAGYMKEINNDDNDDEVDNNYSKYKNK